MSEESSLLEDSPDEDESSPRSSGGGRFVGLSLSGSVRVKVVACCLASADLVYSDSTEGDSLPSGNSRCDSFGVAGGESVGWLSSSMASYKTLDSALCDADAQYICHRSLLVVCYDRKKVERSDGEAFYRGCDRGGSSQTAPTLGSCGLQDGEGCDAPTVSCEHLTAGSHLRVAPRGRYLWHLVAVAFLTPRLAEVNAAVYE